MVVDVLLKEQTHSKEEGAPGQAPGVKGLEGEGTPVSLGSIAPGSCQACCLLFRSESLRRQQENMTFIRDNACNSAALTLSRAARIARAQAPSSCPLHTNENIKNIQIRSRTKPKLLWAEAQLLPGHRVAFQPVWAAARCGRRFSGICSWAKCKVIVVMWWASERNWMNSSVGSRISF